MIKENKDQIVVPRVNHEQVNREYHKFLRRHGWAASEMGVAPLTIKGVKHERNG